MGGAYFEPSSLHETLALLAEHGNAIDVVAGGTDIVVRARSGLRPLRRGIIAIHRLDELSGISVRNGGLRIGALVSHSELEESPAVRSNFTALADAAALVGSPATRNVGTIGGNVSNASPAMETASPLLCFEANVELQSAESVRSLPLKQFLQGPGRTARAPGELVTAINIQAPPTGRAGSAYIRLEYRQAMEIAVVGAAAFVLLDEDGRIAEGRLALTAVAPICLRVPAAERLLAGEQPTTDVLSRAAEAAASGVAPIDDVRGSAEYRRAMVPVIARRALEHAVRRAHGEIVPVPAVHSLTTGGVS